MSKKGKRILFAALALVLAVLLAACNEGGGEVSSTAKVRVVGSLAATTPQTQSRSTTTDVAFDSGTVKVDGQDITDQLTPTNTTATGGANNVEFTAEVPVTGTTVEYSIIPREGFVFDEWEIDRVAIRKAMPDTWRRAIREIKEATRGDAETITIAPDYIQYLLPQFDRGGYYDPKGTAQNPDGTKEAPFNKVDQVITAISNQNRKDDIEFTIKVKAGSIDSIDLSTLSTLSANQDELEIELKILGGYTDGWLEGDARTEIKAITLPTFTNAPKELELEIDFRNIAFTSLDYSDLTTENDDIEIEYENCAVETLTVNKGAVVDSMLITKLADGTTDVKFANSRVPYTAGNSYWHCIITGYSSGEIKGENNIVFLAENATAPTDDSKNIYLASDDQFEGYMKEGGEGLGGATPLKEDAVESSLGDDDILEEDILDRERYLLEDDEVAGRITVSYGPYEYNTFDD